MFSISIPSPKGGNNFREVPEAVRSRHEEERWFTTTPTDTDWQAEEPLCVYVKVVYNANFTNQFGGNSSDGEQAAADVFKRAQDVFATFPGLDRSINLQLVGCKKLQHYYTVDCISNP